MSLLLRWLSAALLVCASWASVWAQGVLPVLDRMDRDGARYTFAKTKIGEGGLTEKEHDLDTAMRGAYARRDRMLFGMTKAEQRAFKTRRR